MTANQNIRMISEGSCDTEDWSNGSFAITGINYILKYIAITHNVTVLVNVWYNKYSLGEQKTSFR